jgi:hypothetical protein
VISLVRGIFFIYFRIFTIYSWYTNTE